MFNVAVFKMKDMVKYFVGITITILVVITTTKYFLNNKKEKTNKTNIIESQVQKILAKSYAQCIDTQISCIGAFAKKQEIESEAEKETTDTRFLKEFLKTEISSIRTLENNTEENIQQNEISEETQEKTQEKEQEKQQTEEVQLATTGQQTEVITANPIKETFNTQYRKCKNKKLN